MVPPLGDSVSRSDIRSARSVAITASVLVLLAGLLSLLGWLVPIYRLTDWDGNGISIKFNTALAIILAATGVLINLLAPDRRWLVWPLAIGAALIGSATLAQHLFGLDLKIDNFFVQETRTALASASPGRMGPPASTMLTLIGAALLMSTQSPRFRRIASGLGLVTIAISTLSLAGYLYGASELYSLPHVTGIAAQTALMLAVLGLAVVANIPEQGIAAALVRNDTGGAMFRRLLVPVLTIAFSLGLLRVWGQQMGLYDTAFGTAARTVAEVVLLIGLLWWAASSVSRSDRQIRLVSRMPEENPYPVLRLTPDGEVIYSNPAAKRLVEEIGPQINDEISDRVMAAVGESFQAGERREMEMRIDDRTFLTVFAPVPDLGHVNVYASDITQRVTAEAKSAQQAREQEVLYRLTDSVHHANTIEEVYDAALEAIIDGLQSDRGSILLFDDKGVMSFVASRGLSDEYKTAVTGHTPWTQGQLGAIPITIPNIDDAGLTDELRTTIKKEGIRALAFIPLNASSGELIGKFMVYYDAPHDWSVSDLELATTVGRQIAFGIERKKTEQALRDNQERLQLATQTGKVGIWEWDINADRVTWSDSLYTMHGIGPDGFDGTSDGFGKLIHPEDGERVRAAMRASVTTGEPYETEFRAKRPDGSVAWIYTNAVIIGAGENRRMIGASVEVTERKEVELAAQQLADIVRWSNDAVIGLDLTGQITSWNNGAESTFGYAADEIVGRHITKLVPEERWPEETHILDGIRRGEAIEHYETVRVRKDGTPLDISLTVSPIRDATGTIIGASKIARDMTHRKRIDAAIRARETLQRIVEAQEAERNRIARDLHDHLGQQLTGLRLKLTNIKRLAADAPAIVQQVDEACDQANQMDTDMSLLAWELRPVSLDSHGLSESLASFVREWGKSHGIKAEFQSLSKNGRLAPDVETNLYRIAQEALNNILKHAKAKEVSVTFNQTGNEAVLVIEDDGRGFEPEKTGASAQGGLGLVGMRERATLLGGRLEIESKPGSGTAIYARIPADGTPTPAASAAIKA